MDRLGEVIHKEKVLSKRNLNNINSSTNNNISTNVNVVDVINNLRDIIPISNSCYMPFYISRLRALGYDRFIELANKARAGKSPARLFFWMLKNNQLVV